MVSIRRTLAGTKRLALSAWAALDFPHVGRPDRQGQPHDVLAGRVWDVDRRWKRRFRWHVEGSTVRRTPVARRRPNLLCCARSRSISSIEKPQGYGVMWRVRLSTKLRRNGRSVEDGAAGGTGPQSRPPCYAKTSLPALHGRRGARDGYARMRSLD